jgi:ribonuclease BN (tRNA processing enzyme)
MPNPWRPGAIATAMLAATIVTAGLVQAPATRTRVLMLGTGPPAPDPDRFGPATAVVVDSTAYLVDAGVGVLRGWSAASTRGLVHGAEPPRVAFITHLHSDHTLGLPELLFGLWMQMPRREIVLFGPKGLRAMTTHMLAAWTEDVRVRTGRGGEMNGASPPRVTVHEIEPGRIYQDARVTVTALAVHHGTWEYAYGYRFDTPDKVIVFSGDAAPPSAIRSNASSATSSSTKADCRIPWRRRTIAHSTPPPRNWRRSRSSHGRACSSSRTSVRE